LLGRGAGAAAGVITGSDRYLDGAGAQDWKLAGVVTVAYGDGPDVSGSAAGRAGAEGIWVPTALLPRFRVSWSAADAHLTARHRLEPVPDPVGGLGSVGGIPTRPDRGLGTGSAVRSPATVASQASPSLARGALDGLSGPIGGQPASSSGTRSPACRSLHCTATSSPEQRGREPYGRHDPRPPSRKVFGHGCQLSAWEGA
jgi:hypothetical protein